MLLITRMEVEENKLLVFNLLYQELLHLAVKWVTSQLNELEVNANGS